MADAAKIGIEDVGDDFRVDVCRAWRTTQMIPTWQAQLLRRHRTSRSSRWVPIGKPVLNDDGPIQAISDLLSALDLGVLPR